MTAQGSSVLPAQIQQYNLLQVQACRMQLLLHEALPVPCKLISPVFNFNIFAKLHEHSSFASKAKLTDPMYTRGTTLSNQEVIQTLKETIHRHTGLFLNST